MFYLYLFIICYYLYLFISLLFSYLNIYVYTCVCTCVYVCAMAHKWRSESNLQELVLLCAFWILKSGLQAWYLVLLPSKSSPLSFLNHSCVQTEFPALVVCFYLSICFECACVCGIHAWSPKINVRFFFWMTFHFICWGKDSCWAGSPLILASSGSQFAQQIPVFVSQVLDLEDALTPPYLGICASEVMLAGQAPHSSIHLHNLYSIIFLLFLFNFYFYSVYVCLHVCMHTCARVCRC